MMPRIADVAMPMAEDNEFDVLQAAVIEAGLVGGLSSTDDQFTVFAPSDGAFVSTFRAASPCWRVGMYRFGQKSTPTGSLWMPCVRPMA